MDPNCPPLSVVIHDPPSTTSSLTALGHNPLESLSNARDRKSQKEIYLQALSDLEAKGFASQLAIHHREWLTRSLPL